MSIFFTYNDTLYKEGTAIITPNNHALRYGDGLFETVRVNKGKIQLGNYHFERLFSGMKMLQFEIPGYYTAVYFKDKIAALCEKNQHNSYARVRLMVFRGNGGLYDVEDHPNYIIQTWNIEETAEFDPGIIIDVYHGAKKSCDQFANLKSNNFLPYVMAAIHTKRVQANDCILLNNYDRICDTAIANIFILKDGIIYTPPLTEGCVAGVMRRFVIETLQAKVLEKPLSIEDVKNADEVFLTNAIRGIMWVKQFGEVKYQNEKVKEINTFIQAELRKEN